MSERISWVRRARVRWEALLPRITGGVLFVLLGLFLVATVFPPLGSWLGNLEFGGPALIVAVALLFLDVLTADRGSSPEQPVFEDSLRLAPRFAEAARQAEISIDFAGDSSETFKMLLRETLRAVQATPTFKSRTISLRILVPDLSLPIAVPCDTQLGDDAAYRAKNWDRTRAALGHIVNELDDFWGEGQVRSMKLEVRFHRLVPTVKLYVLNRVEAYWALYRIERRTSAVDGAPVWDTRGTNAPVFMLAAGGDSSTKQQLWVLTSWYSNLWDSVSYALPEFPIRSWGPAALREL